MATGRSSQQLTVAHGCCPEVQFRLYATQKHEQLCQQDIKELYTTSGGLGGPGTESAAVVARPLA
jgi:hypothetical protein